MYQHHKVSNKLFTVGSKQNTEDSKQYVSIFLHMIGKVVLQYRAQKKMGISIPSSEKVVFILQCRAKETLYVQCSIPSTRNVMCILQY